MFHVHLRLFILVLLDGMLCICLLALSGLIRSSSPVFLIVVRVCLSFSCPFHCAYFLIRLMCRSRSACSGFPLEVLAPCVAVYSLYLWKEGSSLASYIAILVDSGYFFNYFYKGNYFKKGLNFLNKNLLEK